jgi:hypothetical protein
MFASIGSKRSYNEVDKNRLMKENIAENIKGIPMIMGKHTPPNDILISILNGMESPTKLS